MIIYDDNNCFEKCIMDQHPVQEAMEVLWVRATEESEPQKLSVNKHLLAANSPFFHALFFGPFKERGNNRYELVQTRIESLKVMVAILDVFEDASVNRENVADLLSLSKEYLVPAVHKKCIKFLTNESDGILFKLGIAEQFELSNVENLCFNKLVDLTSPNTNTLNQVDASFLRKFIVSGSPQNRGDYAILSDRLKRKLLDKILSLDYVDTNEPSSIFGKDSKVVGPPTANNQQSTGPLGMCVSAANNQQSTWLFGGPVGTTEAFDFSKYTRNQKKQQSLF